MNMDDYEDIHKKAIELANKTLEAAISVCTISSMNQKILFPQLEEFHRSKMVDSGLSLEKYENIVDIALKLTGNDLNSPMGQEINSIDKEPFFLGKVVEHIECLLKVEKPQSTIESKEEFIVLNHPVDFYQKLESEINICYACGAYTAVLILSRKLIENLLIDILRKKYGDRTQEDVEVYFSTDLGRFHDFTVLLRNFDERKADFKVDKDIIEQFFDLIRPFKKGANRKTHSIVHLIEKKEELESYNIQKLASLLMRLFRNISSRKLT